MADTSSELGAEADADSGAATDQNTGNSEETAEQGQESDSDSDSDDDNGAIDVEVEDEATDVDYSQRGNAIGVTGPLGSVVERVDGRLPAGGSVLYSFAVAEGQSVLVRQLGGCAFSNSGPLKVDVAGPRGIGGGIFLREDCTESKRYDAAEAGAVILTFADPDPTFSAEFAFEVIDVTDEPAVELEYGDRVAADVPIAGAGILEFPGSRDVYRFEVQAGDAYLVRQLGCELENTRIFALRYEGVGSGSGSMQSPCDSSDRFEANESGTVLIHVTGGSSHEGTGAYSFELIDLNATAAFQLQIGSVVAPDLPAKGAGAIEEPGGQDVYSLDVVEGQTIVISQLGGCEFAGGKILQMTFDGAGVGGGLFFNGGEGEDNCYDVKRFVAEQDDTVTMKVQASSNEITGTYSFEVGLGAETIEEAEEVLEDLNSDQVDDERLITLDETVLFDFGSAELRANSNQALADVADVLGVYTTGAVRIIGHTDSVGSDSDNERLSQKRAEAIQQALIDLGVSAERLSATGAGEGSPIEPNENSDGTDSPDGRAANRRVEIFFSTAEP